MSYFDELYINMGEIRYLSHSLKMKNGAYFILFLLLYFVATLRSF